MLTSNQIKAIKVCPDCNNSNCYHVNDLIETLEEKEAIIANLKSELHGYVRAYYGDIDSKELEDELKRLKIIPT